MKIASPFIFAIFTLFCFSCDMNQVFEKNENINGEEWQYADTVNFSIDITDTTSRYNLYLNVRHSQQYQWRNLWVVLHTKLPSGKVSDTRIDLPLAEADGKWYGKCTGDICYIQIPIQMNAIFPESGLYDFSVEQNMRQNPLPYILGVGLRIEKSS